MYALNHNKIKWSAIKHSWLLQNNDFIAFDKAKTFRFTQFNYVTNLFIFFLALSIWNLLALKKQSILWSLINCSSNSEWFSIKSLISNVPIFTSSSLSLRNSYACNLAKLSNLIFALFFNVYFLVYFHFQLSIRTVKWAMKMSKTFSSLRNIQSVFKLS